MVNNKLIKVCGMCEGENIREVESPDIDMIGFIFYSKSPRYLCEMPDYMPANARRVGVFVNEDKQTIEMFADRFSLDFIQLHGNESPEYCRSLQLSGLKLIKAFPIASRKDLQNVHNYSNFCKYFLFDTKCEQRGGSGNQFDWSILHIYKGRTPFILSGGINPYSAKALKEFQHPLLVGYDLNSRFEVKPGKKDVQRIHLFLNELR